MQGKAQIFAPTGANLGLLGLDDSKQFTVALCPNDFPRRGKARLSIRAVPGWPGGIAVFGFLTEPIEKRFAILREPLLELLCAIARAACPRLGPIFISATAPVMGILYPRQIEVFFPVRALFQQRAWTITDLNPAGGLIFTEPRVVHIAEILASRNRSSAQGLFFNCLQEVGFAARFDSCPDKVAHDSIVIPLCIQTGSFCIKRSDVTGLWARPGPAKRRVVWLRIGQKSEFRCR
jgi:hypothetical protein